MEKRIDAWVDKKLVISVTLGVLLAAWVAWLGAVLLHGAGIGGYGQMGHGMGSGYGRSGMMQRGDAQGMRDRMQRMMQQDNTGAAGTYESGAQVLPGTDTSAQ